MQNFWDVHGVFFILFLFFFPRLTLLFSSVVSGGLFWWLGWIFAPRLLVAILATSAYWQSNVILVVLTWIWALGLESGEKLTVVRSRPGRRRPPDPRDPRIIDVEARRD